MTESTALSKCFARQGVPIHIRKYWCPPSSAGCGDAAAAEGDGEGSGGTMQEAEGEGGGGVTMGDGNGGLDVDEGGDNGRLSRSPTQTFRNP
ncbi:hypothetical protein HDU87_000437 [Geranomyces variabilis]|uniref:Uncharacterized protein n=1 Tax=Geranomyces variabilis TaxID=109894 RepID=A0AAD5TNK1_9FUNG|nr:hypothetical protein HDU87_000437 [Geranomyces variabilis]